MLGKISAREGNLDVALKYLQRAIDLMSDGKPTHASVGAAKFQQGCVYMLYGKKQKDMEALRSFKDALSIAQMSEAGKGTQADSARVKWRMSQVMERQGMVAEAKAFSEAASATKEKLLATGLFATASGDEELEYDSLVGLLYR
jgi:ATP/maltotriose-dependent transcriptional regulator MalT